MMLRQEGEGSGPEKGCGIRAFFYDADGQDKELPVPERLPDLEERQLLWVAVIGRDGKAIADLMNQFKSGPVSVPDPAFAKARALFDSCAVNDALTCKTIADVFAESEYLLDPHSAIGVYAARQCQRDKAIPMVTLATAHPAKFRDVVEPIVGAAIPLPDPLAEALARKKAVQRISPALNDLAKLL